VHRKWATKAQRFHCKPGLVAGEIFQYRRFRRGFESRLLA
jgi:hypothetical protein